MSTCLVCGAFFIACAALWIASYQRAIDIATGSDTGGQRVQVFINRGLLMLFFFPEAPAPRDAYATAIVYPEPAVFDGNYWARSHAGFSAVETQIPDSATLTPRGWMISGNETWEVRRELGIPLWSLTAIGGVATLLTLRPVLRQYRQSRAGHCPACGYDLRSGHARCPECGRVTAVTS